MEGIVPLLKPPGLSSSDCVVDVRRLFQEKRGGHLGTLDPGAAGILPVCVGRAVRLFDYLVDPRISTAPFSGSLPTIEASESAASLIFRFPSAIDIPRFV